MRIPALVIAVALGCSASAFANSTHDSGPSTGSASSSGHALAADFRGAVHKLGDATRHALRRADAALHRASHRDNQG